MRRQSSLRLSCHLSLVHRWHPRHYIATALEGEQDKQVRTKRISPAPLPPVSSANEAPLPCTLSKAAGSLARLLFSSSSGSSSLSVLWASKGSASRGSPGFVPPVPDPANPHPHQTAISPNLDIISIISECFHSIGICRQPRFCAFTARCCAKLPYSVNGM